MSGGRIVKWDNAKSILMLLVVLGHFTDWYCGQYQFSRNMFVLIYTFHMPAFIFLSGMFSKKTIQSDRMPWRKIGSFLILAVFLNFFWEIVQGILTGSFDFEILMGDNTDWFMMALSAFFLITYLLRNVSPGYVLFVSIAMALIAGFDTHIGMWLSLSRIFVYYPFFYFGYIMSASKYQAFLEKPSVRLISAGILAAFVTIVFLLPDFCYEFRPLLTGAHSYAEIPLSWLPEQWRFLCRLAQYGVSFVICSAFFSLIPRFRMPYFTRTGRQTLSIYFWHMPILSVLNHMTWCSGLAGRSVWSAEILGVIFAFGMTALFSVPVFTRPVNYLVHPKVRTN